MAYINNRRISLAQKLLLDEKLSIKEISIKSGFQDPLYFSRYFKTKTGFTPFEYRGTSLLKHNVK